MHKHKNTVSVDLLDCIAIKLLRNLFTPSHANVSDLTGAECVIWCNQWHDVEPLHGDQYIRTTTAGQELTYCRSFASRRLHKWCVLEIPFPIRMKANVLSEYHFKKHAIRWSWLTSVWHSMCHSIGLLCKPQFMELYANTKRRGFFASSCFRRHLDIWACNWSGKTLLLVLRYGA